MTKGPRPLPLRDRLYRNVAVIDDEDSCWLWTGALLPKRGYGQTFIGSRADGSFRPTYAHRLSWIVHFGEIPPGLCVCHTCDNPTCVRPDHLWLGTRKQNSEDMARKGRTGRHAHPESYAGTERNFYRAGAKVDALTARNIRSFLQGSSQAIGMSDNQVGRIFGCSGGIVFGIRNNKTWKTPECYP